MKRLISLLLASLLLCALASAEPVYETQDWVEEAPGQWLRVITMTKGTEREVTEERASGPTVDQLALTGRRLRNYADGEKLSWSYIEGYDEAQEQTFVANYMYDENGQLTVGTVTNYLPVLKIQNILFLTLTPGEDGAFRIDIRAVDADNNELLTAVVNYDKDGNFLSGERINSQTNVKEKLTEIPVEDQLRPEWRRYDP